MSKESISLSYQDDKSDKFYNIAINEAGENKYTVDFHYGRNGTEGQRGTKTKEPVTFEEAKKEYGKVVKSKKAKGYQE